MSPLTIAMVITAGICAICLAVTLKSASPQPVLWSCGTCGENNVSDTAECVACGMEKDES